MNTSGRREAVSTGPEDSPTGIENAKQPNRRAGNKWRDTVSHLVVGRFAVTLSREPHSVDYAAWFPD